jgi:hypothetical protein
LGKKYVDPEAWQRAQQRCSPKTWRVLEGHARNRLVIRGVPVTASVYSLIADDFSS